MHNPKLPRVNRFFLIQPLKCFTLSGLKRLLGKYVNMEKLQQNYTEICVTTTQPIHNP